MARPVELPNDLVDEILYRVPATSLKRLRATCKRWNRLFKEDTKFASEHRDKAPKEFLFLIMTEKQTICPLSILNHPPHGDDGDEDDGDDGDEDDGDGDDGDEDDGDEDDGDEDDGDGDEGDGDEDDEDDEDDGDGDDGDEDEDDEDDGDEDDVPLLPYVKIKRELSLPDFFNKSLETEVFHCDGLLLCVRDHLQYEIVVWNPFTGQTRWIEANNGWKPFITFVLGYNNNKSSGSQRSYKILCFGLGVKDAEIYDLSSSDSWRRIPDGDLSPPGWGGMFSEDLVSLKGNTYFFAKKKSEPQLGDLSLARFDFSTEKSSLFVPLPYHRPRWEILRLSAVRDEKLSLFLQYDATYKTEIWVTSKIDDDSTKAVSWNKVLAFDLIIIHLQITEDVTFVLDEDKKVALCCERLMDHDDDQLIDKIYILGEDNQFSEFTFVPTTSGPRPFPLNYVPSLVQI